MNMKFATILVLLLSLAQVAILQECRQIISTVCDEDALPPRREGGEKGDVGAPGKAGSPGSKGSKGEVGGIGPKGMKGECGVDITLFREDIMREVEEMIFARAASNSATSTTNQTNCFPTSCATSSRNGRQILNAGKVVFCEDGWTVFQRRFNGSLVFNRNWNEYKHGFGNLSEEFWLGLHEIHNLTMNGGCQLRVDVISSRDISKYAIYSSFSIEDENDNYRLHVSGYSGTAGNGLTKHKSVHGIHDNMEFSTPDRDNDLSHSSNCARQNMAGWWYNYCFDSDLNRPEGGLTWNSRTVQSSTMKLRCLN